MVVGRSDGQGVGGGEDSSLVGKRKCCLVEAVVDQGDRQQQYYLKLLKSLIARLREKAFKYSVLSNYGNDYW